MKVIKSKYLLHINLDMSSARSSSTPESVLSSSLAVVEFLCCESTTFALCIADDIILSCCRLSWETTPASWISHVYSNPATTGDNCRNIFLFAEDIKTSSQHLCKLCFSIFPYQHSLVYHYIFQNNNIQKFYDIQTTAAHLWWKRDKVASLIISLNIISFLKISSF